MTAINYYIYTNNKANNYKYFDNSRNGIYYCDSFNKHNEIDQPNYILNNVSYLQVYNDIYISIITKENTFENNRKNSHSIQIIMTIHTYNHNSKYIQSFINRCINEYNAYNTSINKNKTYHFIYTGKTNKLNFIVKLLSDENNEKYQNYETFDNIYHSNKNIIINDMKRLKNLEYYKKTGLKRKKGYLFYGPPGCGKTASVMAMSNYDKRHIIEIPLSRVKTNSEFEEILSMTQIDNISFEHNEIILLFDEIDIDTKLNRHNDTDSENSDDSETNIFLSPNQTSRNKKNQDNKNDDTSDSDNYDKSSSDKLNLGTLLSRFDGIYNYNGLIIIATTNNINKIDKALYRDGRLTLFKFDYATYDDIKNIIEKYYETTLTFEQLEKIQNIKNLTHSKLRYKLEQYDYNNIELLLENLI